MTTQEEKEQIELLNRIEVKDKLFVEKYQDRMAIRKYFHHEKMIAIRLENYCLRNKKKFARQYNPHNTYVKKKDR